MIGHPMARHEIMIPIMPRRCVHAYKEKWPTFLTLQPLILQMNPLLQPPLRIQDPQFTHTRRGIVSICPVCSCMKVVNPHVKISGTKGITLICLCSYVHAFAGLFLFHVDSPVSVLNDWASGHSAGCFYLRSPLILLCLCVRLLSRALTVRSKLEPKLHRPPPSAWPIFLHTPRLTDGASFTSASHLLFLATFPPKFNRSRTLVV